MGSSGTSGTSGETGSSGTATGTSGSSGMSGSGDTGSSGTSGASGTAGSSTGYDSAGAMTQGQGATAPPMSPNATVAAIEVVPSSSGAAMEGESSASAAMGSSAGGATGSSADRVYRVTLRMDDGSTQVVTQQTTPDFRTGDRVSLAGGMIQH
jgi:hypothetical protein